MKCEVCNQETNKGFMCSNGIACSEDCAQILHGRLDCEYAKLKAEPITEMPEAFTVGDFERWTLKVSLHILEGCTKATRKKLSNNNPMMLVPDQLALEIKDRILKHIPHQYVSSAEVKGHMRMFYGGEYMFRQPIPRGIVVAAAKEAQVIQ